MQILSTKLYSKFKVIGGNRAIHEKHLQTLMASISDTNMLESNPIIVNKNMEVIDGQHRLEAAKRMHLEIHYVVAPDAKVKEVQRLNTAVKRWDLRDYAISYSLTGNKEYDKVLKFCDKYGITMSEAVMMTQKVSKRFSHALYEFREGRHVCDNLSEAIKIAEFAHQIGRFVDPPYTNKMQEDFVRTVGMLDETKPVSVPQFIERITELSVKIPRQNTRRDWMRAFETAYNKGLSANQVRFF